MRTIARDELARVSGGDSSTTTIGPYQSSQTDYAKCAETVTAMTAQQYPDTRPWWNPFATDDNAGKRAEATVANLSAACGLPPT